jgi:hypothetical protein
MSDTVAADHTEAGDPAAPPDAGRRSRLGWVIGLVLLLAGALVLAWLLVAASQRAQVVVWFDAQAVTCRDGVVTVESIDGDGPTLAGQMFVHVVEATPEVGCALRFHVENRGARAATLHRVEMPLHGPRNRNGLRAGELSPLCDLPQTIDDDGLPATDASYRIDHRLDPGEGLALSIALHHVPDGCLDEDTTFGISDSPKV